MATAPRDRRLDAVLLAVRVLRRFNDPAPELELADALFLARTEVVPYIFLAVFQTTVVGLCARLLRDDETVKDVRGVRPVS